MEPETNTMFLAGKYLFIMYVLVLRNRRLWLEQVCRNPTETMLSHSLIYIRECGSTLYVGLMETFRMLL